MKLIKPIEVTPERLISSSVPEDDAPAWGPEGYAVGSRVIHQHRLYEALVDVPAGVEPGAEVVTVAAPAKWLDLGAANRWKMFDDRVESQTAAAGSISVVVAPGQVVDAVTLLNVAGAVARVTVTDPIEGLVYEREESLIEAGADDWYEWFFAPVERVTDLTLLDLPAYGAGEVSVVIDNFSDLAAVGHVVLGMTAEVGVAQYGSSVGITDFSRKERDSFGNAVVVPRSFSKRAEFDVWLETRLVGVVQRLLASLRARPVVWIGESSMEATILFGFYRDFDITISGPEISDAVITIEGLV